MQNLDSSGLHKLRNDGGKRQLQQSAMKHNQDTTGHLLHHFQLSRLSHATRYLWVFILKVTKSSQTKDGQTHTVDITEGKIIVGMPVKLHVD